MLATLLPVIMPVLGDLFKSWFPDPAEAQKRQNEMMLALMANEHALKMAGADIVKSEAESSNWLTSSWRPIVMLTFTVLIVARWFGWAAPNLAEAEYLKLWDIVELGLGGYVIGRSVEKTAPAIVGALKK
jgi:hypothetical protein